jgi:WD40 repeat protein
MRSPDVFGKILVFEPESVEPLQFTLEDARLTPRSDWETIAFFAWSPDGNAVVMAENSYAEADTAISRHQVVLLNIRTLEVQILRPRTQYRWSHNPQWSRTGRYVAVTRWFDSGEPILLWSFENGRPQAGAAMDNNLWSNSVWCAAFAPDDRRIAALAWADSQSVLLILELDTLRLIKRADLPFAPTILSWHYDNRTLVLSGSLDSGETASFDLATERLVMLPFESSSGARCHPYRDVAAFASPGRITIGDLSQGTIVSDQTLAADETVNDICWSLDGSKVHAVSSQGRVYTFALTS